MPLWDTLQTPSTLRNSSSMEFTTRLVETSWQRILAIAQNHLYELPHEDIPHMQARPTTNNSGRVSSTQSSRQTSRSSTTTSTTTTTTATTTTRRNNSRRVSSQEFYDRERRMIHALDTLFNLAYEGRKKKRRARICFCSQHLVLFAYRFFLFPSTRIPCVYWYYNIIAGSRKSGCHGIPEPRC